MDANVEVTGGCLFFYGLVDYLAFLRAALASSIARLAAKRFLVLGECLDLVLFLSPVGRFAIYLE